MKAWHILLGAGAIGAAAYLGLQAQDPGIEATTGLLILGMKNNPKYVQLGVFLLLLAGAFAYYNNFNSEN